MSIEARTVLVTGASSGIGRAVAEILRDAGHRVVGTARQVERLPPGLAATEALDLADLDDSSAALEALAGRHPEIDALVLCAGRGLLGSLEEQPPDDIRRLIDLNLTAQILCARVFFPRLKRRGGGDLIFMGSEAALAGRRNGAVYCAAKFGLRGFAQALREEGMRRGVRVTLINPGMVRTPFFDPLPILPGPEPEHALEAGDVASTVAMVLEAPGRVVFDEIDLSPLRRGVVERKRD